MEHKMNNGNHTISRSTLSIIIFSALIGLTIIPSEDNIISYYLLIIGVAIIIFANKDNQETMENDYSNHKASNLQPRDLDPKHYNFDKKTAEISIPQTANKEELTITMVTEQLSELLAQVELIVREAITHILTLSSEGSTPTNRPDSDNSLRRLSLSEITENISSMETNTAYIALQTSCLNQRQHPLATSTDKAQRVLSEEISRITLISMKGRQLLKRLASDVKANIETIEAVELPKDTRQYLRRVEASITRLRLISDSMPSAIDRIIDNKATALKRLKREDPTDNNIPEG